MESITVGFDGKRAVRNMTGLGNYSRLVVESLSRAYPRMQLRLYSPSDGDSPRFNKVKALPNVSLRTPKRGEARLGGSVWRTFSIPSLLRAEGVALYHGLSNELPLNIASCGIPSVVTIHDVIYRRLPYCYKKIDRAVYDFKYGRSCRNATRIIAVSECTKRDIMEYYGIAEEKIDVVYQGCDDIFKTRHSAGEIAAVKKKHGLTAPYIIQVGSIERRKNAMLSVQSLNALPKEMELVLVGRGTAYLNELEKTGRSLGVWPRVRVLSDVPFAELPLLYQGASAAVYPSRYEGFGIPVLEALCSRIPCVAATGSCLEEAGGDGALYVNPDNARELGNLLNQLLADTALRTRQIEAGLLHARRFDNREIPGRIMAVYRHAMGCR